MTADFMALTVRDVTYRGRRAGCISTGAARGRTVGGRVTRGWKKLHLGVDRSGVIVAHALTETTVDDATVGADLLGATAGGVASVTGDGAYDTVAFYAAATARHAQVDWRWPSRP